MPGNLLRTREIDITDAALALGAMDHVRSVARVATIIGLPLSVFVVIGEIHARSPVEGRFWIWAAVSLLLLPVAILAFSFAIATMRPLLGAAVMILAAGPALVAMGQYAAGAGPWEEQWREYLPLLLVLAVFAAPPLVAWWRVAWIPRQLRLFARPAPALAGPVDLLRLTFGVWPGVRQDWWRMVLATVFSHLSTLLLWVGVLVLVPVGVLVFLLLPLLAATKGLVDVVGPVVLLLGAALLLLCAQNLLRGLARWFSRAALADRVERDPRPPLLFLRSFQDDQVRLPERNRLSELYRQVLSPGTGRRRLDHLLVENFSRYGPAVALGRPGEKTLPFGAARVYAAHDRWQEKVLDLAATSRQIILVVDATPGVEWEIETLLKAPFLQKTLFLCAPRSADVREHPGLGRWLSAETGVTETGNPVLAVFLNGDDELVLLRCRHPRSSQAFIVAMQTCFRLGAK